MTSWSSWPRHAAEVLILFSLFWVVSVNVCVQYLTLPQMILFLSFQTPLHYAAVSGQGDVCLELLLNDGASPNLQVRNDQSYYQFIMFINPLHPKSVCKFSILFSIHFLKCWQGEMCLKIKSFISWWSFLDSCDLNVWFRGDIVRRN